MFTVEIWKDIPGYEGLYQASTLGRIRSLGRRITNKNGTPYVRLPRDVKCQLNEKGYKRVSFTDINGNRHTEFVHRLVASAFIPNPDNLLTVNHKDECKVNNIPENLEWCTSQYNSEYGTGRYRSAEKNKRTIDRLTWDGEYIDTWPSAVDYSLYAFGNKSKEKHIQRVLAGRRQHTCGYAWRYHDLKETKVYGCAAYTVDGGLVGKWTSQLEGAKATGISATTVSCKIKSGKPDKNGHVWKYLKKDIGGSEI